MLDQKIVFEELTRNHVDFYVGVPDSYLNGFCGYAQNVFPERIITAANEGNAIGIAAGHFFATGDIPLVYMQNSGIGNALNPLVSLADKDVYAVPMLLLVGWRGQGNSEPKHPQHKLQGKITPDLFDLMNIPYAVLKDDNEDFKRVLAYGLERCKRERIPFALISPKGVMAGPKDNSPDGHYPMSREEAMAVVLDTLPLDTIYSATTGRATRELFFLREERKEKNDHDFLNVGSMGHASSVAFGIAISKPNRRVVVFDGDAAAIMHMGALTMTSRYAAPNFMHLVLNNGVHESVGGHPSAGQTVDFTKIAEACGYKTIGKPVTNKEELVDAIKVLCQCGRASFIDVRIHKGIRENLPPLDFNHRQAIDSLIEKLNDD